MIDAAPPVTDPWRMRAAEVAESLGTDPEAGLSGAEAAARLARYGPNHLEGAPPVPAWRRFLSQFESPLVLLLLGAVGISLATWAMEGAEGAPFDAIAIGLILVVNAVLGYVEEVRASQAVAALQRMAAATSTVVRDGAEREVPATELVPGDLLCVSEGDAVSADARLVEAAALTVSEAPLTGESEPVLKDPAVLVSGPVALADRVNMVHRGTAVTRGRGRAVVTATGRASETGRIAELLEATEEERTPLQVEIDRVGRLLGLAVIAIAVVVVAAILLTSDIADAADVADVLLIGVSLAVAAVPEGLPAILTVVLALGVQRMARENAIVTKLSSVETLGSASVIGSDKTGTLTRNEMTIERIVTRSGDVTVTGTGYRPEGRFLVDGSPLTGGPLLEEVRYLLGAGGLANDASLREEEGAWQVQGDPTEAAFLVAERKAGVTLEREARFTRVGELPFTSERKLMTTLNVDAEEAGRIAVATKGAPDVLLARCTHEQVGSGVEPLTDARRREVAATVDRLADRALRTLAVAYRPLATASSGETAEDIERELILVGVVGIIDPPRAEARPSIAEAQRAGIRVVMITGDHPRTAARIGADLGIVEPGAAAVSGVELEVLDDRALRSVVADTSVFARVAPEHKLRIVDALQADGSIVAMTGDGVNDAPALKSADIGIAMGRAGTDVTKESAKMILADDNFATIVAAVREGRAIFANIRKFLRYLLTSNAGEVLTMFLGVVGATVIGLDMATGVAAPLLATQILWVNLLTDAGPALAMGLDPPPEDVMARPPRPLGARLIDAPMRRSIGYIGLVMAVVTLLTLDISLPGGLVEGSDGLTEARTMAFTVLVLAQLFNCFNARSEGRSAFHDPFSNRWLWGAVAVSGLLQVLVVYAPFLHEAFGTTPLDGSDWLLCLAMASAVLWADELRKLAGRMRSVRSA
ncbi:MAG TPA: cation-translocating P-type ATPase [Acidimicrobiales bacterium]